MIKELHRKKIPALFIKLDIPKAFDIVNWSYMLDIMTYIGFGARWRDWIEALWGTTSSSFLINGEPGRKIIHHRGVRQGDPLFPMIFLPAMEPLHRMFSYAQSVGVLNYLHDTCASFRMSLYADDVAVFIMPTAHDPWVTKNILKIFGEASSLITNMEKQNTSPLDANI
jgi:hypothetical protein